MKSLIVVDVQVDFCEGGSLAVAGGNQLAKNIAHLLETDHGYDLVIATRDHHISPGNHFSDHPDFINSWPTHCVVGTPGQEINPALAHYPFQAIFDKGEYAAAYSGFEGKFQQKTMVKWLTDHNVTETAICGIATDYCVKATALDSVQAGFKTHLLAKYCAAVHENNVAGVLAELQMKKVIVDQ